MIRSPQAFLVSLSLHALMGAAILYFVAPNLLLHERAAEARCSIVLSQVIPVFPAAGETVKTQTARSANAEADVRKTPARKTEPVPASEHAPAVKMTTRAAAKPVPVEAVPVAEEVPVMQEASEMPVSTPAPVVMEHTETLPEPTQAAPAPQAEKPSVEQQTSETYMNEHLAVIARLLRENLYYPKLARKRHLEGEVLAAFTLLADGTIREVTVKKHAREILDRAAVRTIESLSGLMPHPQSPLTIEVPIRFVLK